MLLGLTVSRKIWLMWQNDTMNKGPGKCKGCKRCNKLKERLWFCTLYNQLFSIVEEPKWKDQNNCLTGKQRHFKIRHTILSNMGWIFLMVLIMLQWDAWSLITNGQEDHLGEKPKEFFFLYGRHCCNHSCSLLNCICHS